MIRCKGSSDRVCLQAKMASELNPGFEAGVHYHIFSVARSRRGKRRIQ